MSESILYERRGPTARLTLNRPEKLNAMNAEMVQAIRANLARARGDDEVKIVVLAGAGRAFSAGFDIAEEVTSEIEGADRWHEVLAADVEMTMEIWSFPSRRSPPCAAGAWPTAARWRWLAT